MCWCHSGSDPDEERERGVQTVRKKIDVGREGLRTGGDVVGLLSMESICGGDEIPPRVRYSTVIMIQRHTG